jgi:hypothetical protein
MIAKSRVKSGESLTGQASMLRAANTANSMNYQRAVDFCPKRNIA